MNHLRIICAAIIIALGVLTLPSCGKGDGFGVGGNVIILGGSS